MPDIKPQLMADAQNIVQSHRADGGDINELVAKYATDRGYSPKVVDALTACVNRHSFKTAMQHDCCDEPAIADPAAVKSARDKLLSREAVVALPVKLASRTRNQTFTKHAALAQVKTASDDMVPPEAVRASLKKGIKLYEEGKGGDGLVSATVDWARRLAGGEAITPDKVKKMSAWHARHGVDKRPGWDKAGEESPGYVAFLLWGGDAGKAWADRLVKSAGEAPTVDYTRAVQQRLQRDKIACEAEVLAKRTEMRLGLEKMSHQAHLIKRLGLEKTAQFQDLLDACSGPVAAVLDEVIEKAASQRQERVGPTIAMLVPQALRDFENLKVASDRIVKLAQDLGAAQQKLAKINAALSVAKNGVIAHVE